MLYTFTGGADGDGPFASLVFDSKGNLYGTAAGGGDGSGCGGYGCGVVFELSPPTHGGDRWTETVLYAFTGGSDGGEPNGVIFDSQGNLYGTTTEGGNFGCFDVGCGVVFELSPPAHGSGPWIENVLYTFQGSTDGGVPQFSSVTFDPKGNLYGTTSGGATASASTQWAVAWYLK